MVVLVQQNHFISRTIDNNYMILNPLKATSVNHVHTFSLLTNFAPFSFQICISIRRLELDDYFALPEIPAAHAADE